MAQWKEKALPNGTLLHISNTNVPLSDDVQCLSDFLSSEDEARILQEIEDEQFTWEGFDQRRRVQRFSLDANNDNNISAIHNSVIQLRSKIEDATTFQFTHAFVEEYAPETFSDSSNQIVTTFESSCQELDCSKCCVALIPLLHSAQAHWNRPKKRQAMCWTLESANHQTNVMLKRGSVYIRSGDNLHFWRSRIAGMGNEKGLFIKLYSYSSCSDALYASDDAFGYVPSQVPLPIKPMPPMQEILTIIVTTSPIRSNPSLELLEKVFETFCFAGDSFCFKCRKITVCDGCRTQDGFNDSVSRRHQNTKQAMRSGIVTPEQAEKYHQFKVNLKDRCAKAPADSPFYNTVVEELEERHGFAYALRHVVRSMVDTEYICVIQHDRTFMRSTPIEETLRAMWNNPGVKYVGCSMRSNLFYKDIFYSKYGRSYSQDYANMTLHPTELLFDSALYGPESESCQQALVANPQLKDNLLALAEKYRETFQYLDQRAQGVCHDRGQHQMTLSPTLFWYDNIHLASTQHYNEFIFNSSYKMVTRGGFVEEGVFPVLKKTLDRLGLVKGHERFGCYLLDDHSGFFFTGHLDGGSYIQEEMRYDNKK
ncbi:hypothetical protein MPSEU_000390100 [Mayamaea pseudoterrestris]|nr:hypothetical protein MPSEU_000390100 [Mayamaea pseudoterrestris]